MFRKPARIVAIVAGLAMLFVESAYATRVDPNLVNLTPASNATMVRLPGEVLGALKQATLIKSPRDAGKQPITLTMVLKREHQKTFEHYLHEIYDPHSPHYHHFLTQAEIASRFGPSQKSYDAVLAYLERDGFKLVQGSKNRMTITVRGTRAIAERTFHVKIADYQAGGKIFYANEKAPAMPKQLAASVESVVGLSSQARLEAAGFDLGQAIINLWLWAEQKLVEYLDSIDVGFQKLKDWVSGLKFPGPNIIPHNNVSFGQALNAAQSGQVAGGLLKPSTASVTVTPSACTWSALDGSGQTIGLVAFDTFQTSDVADFLAMMGAPATEASQVTVVPVDGGATSSTHESETLLAIDEILTTAPGAQIRVYEAPYNGAGSFQPVINQMINDNVSIIANTWSYCEDQTTAADADSIDSLFQTAATAGISVFNATGDSGSSCSDGSANMISVPADSPNATAVGGTSFIHGRGTQYGSETWWNGASAIPPSGQGGFGVSKFFTRPAYQDGLDASPMRSVPDVSADADPAHLGFNICEADGGGCPAAGAAGGTSEAVGYWAAFQALINQSLGHNLGFVNPVYYGFADTGAFHDAASMGSDFQHVGLGSPNLSALALKACGQSAGTPSSEASGVAAFAREGLLLSGTAGIPDDGKTPGEIQVILRDSNGFPVSGKTVTITANAGSSAVISPSSAVTNANNGSAVFNVTDSTPEDVTFSATDVTDGINLSQTTAIPFVAPPATSANISGGPSSVSANGNATITVTLQDSLGRPTPGKLVTLSQNGGQSVITGPDPSVTDSNGEIQFSATDVNSESITYTATDVTDGNLPVPGSVSVDFTGNGGCSGGTPPAAPGYAVSTFASGFTAQNFFNGNLNVGDCPGANGMAFGPNGNLYVADMPTGEIYKIPPSGGAADSSTLLTQTAVGAAITGLAFDPSGNLFATILAPPGTPISSTSSEVIQVDPNTGQVIGNPLVAGLPCLWSLKTDPLSGDLFTDATCSPPDNSPDIWRIENPASSPSTVVYATTPNTSGNTEIDFAPDGTMYVDAQGKVLSITGTNTTNPGTVSTIPNAVAFDSGMAVGGMQSATGPSPGDSQFLLLTVPGNSSSTTSKTQTFDLTAATPGPGVTLTGPMPVGDGGYTQDKKIVGPNGCLYLAEGDAVYKITNPDGTCSFGPTTQPPAISLTPTSVSPNPSQGGSVSFTASLHDASFPSGTPVFLTVTGSNPQVHMVRTDANGQASFSYQGIFTGRDNVTASATVGGVNVASNQVPVTWETGQDTTFLSLNLSSKGGTVGQPVTLVASVSDVSQTPATPVSGQTISFSLGGDSCSATTNSNGKASCSITPSAAGTETLSASFGGTTALVASNASTGFTVVKAPAPAPTPTPGGRIEVEPIPVTFGATGINVAAKHRALRIYNEGQRKTLTVSLEPLSAPFTILSGLGPYEIPPGQRIKVKLQFAPTLLGKQHETLVIDSSDKRDPTVDVPVRGKGRPGVPYHYATGFHFHKVGIGVAPASITIHLKNTGLGLLKGTVGTLSAPFQVVAGGGAYSILPGAKLPITVQFAPSDTVHSSATLDITTSDPRIPTVELPVGGTGVGGHLKTNLTIPYKLPVLPLGKTAPSTPVSATFRIINKGKGLLQGNIGTPSMSFFTVTSPSGGGAFTLQPGTHEPVTVQFDPDASGKFVATLPITVMPPSTPAAGLTIRLKGHGS